MGTLSTLRQQVQYCIIIQCNTFIAFFVFIQGYLKDTEGYMESAFRETEEETGFKEKDLDVDYLFQRVIEVF